MKLKNVSAIIAMLLVAFLSGCTKDEVPGVPPTVTSSDPANNAIGVDLNQLIVITFSEPMEQGTINSLTFTLKQDGTSVSGVVTEGGETATFTPTVDMLPNLVYTGTITTGAKNVGGDSMAADHTFTFTTGIAQDIILPTVSSTNPQNNSIDVARNKVISITFSEAMAPLTIDGTSFILKQGSTIVSGAIAYSGLTATLTPSTILSVGTVYTVTINTGAKDLAGNALENNTVWSFRTGGNSAALGVVNLGAAGNYVILAKSAINNSAISAIVGDLGLSPAATSYVTGFSLTNATGYATSAQITGSIFAADMVAPTSTNLTTAVNDMITAYNDAAGRLSPDFLELSTGNIGGKTLTSGLYKWTNTVTVPASVTISGSATDVWIFQIAGDLTASNAINVTLSGGALPENIFWQVAGQVTLGTTSHFEGIILSKTGITLQTGASLTGRALAQTAVILDASTITKPN